MKFFIPFFILLICNINLYAISAVKGNMGVLTDGIADAKQKDYSIAFKILINKISGDQDIVGKLKYYDSEELIIEDFITHKVDYIIMNPLFYLKNQTKLDEDILYYWSIRKYKSKFQKMIIIVRKDSDIDTIFDLKNKIVAIKRDNYIGKIVLEKELLEKNKALYENYIKDSLLTTRHSTAILKTFFNKADVAIVPSYSFDLVSEMNPAIKKEIKVIYQTKTLFMPVLSLIHKEAAPELVNKVNIILNNLDSTTDGKNVFSLFQMQGINVLDYHDLDDLREYYESYLNLKNKNGDRQ